MTRAVLLLGLLFGAALAAQAQRVHGRVVGIRGNTVQVRLSPNLDVRPGIRGTIYGNVRGRQGIIARIQSARKAGNVWTCQVTRTALRIQPGHTVSFAATVTPPPPAEPPPPPEPGTIVLDVSNVDRALVTSGGVRMGRTSTASGSRRATRPFTSKSQATRPNVSSWTFWKAGRPAAMSRCARCRSLLPLSPRRQRPCRSPKHRR